MTLAVLCSGQGLQHPQMFSVTGNAEAAASSVCARPRNCLVDATRVSWFGLTRRRFCVRIALLNSLRVSSIGRSGGAAQGLPGRNAFS